MSYYILYSTTALDRVFLPNLLSTLEQGDKPARKVGHPSNFRRGPADGEHHLCIVNHTNCSCSTAHIESFDKFRIHCRISGIPHKLGQYGTVPERSFARSFISAHAHVDEFLRAPILAVRGGSTALLVLRVSWYSHGHDFGSP